MIHVAIVENEKADRELLMQYTRRFFEEVQHPLVLHVFSDGQALLDNYPEGVQVIFMDIEMEHMDGMAAARALRKFDSNAILVFITNLFQYALDGYAVNAMDFIVKPVYYTSFRDCMDKVMLRVERQGSSLLQVSYDKSLRYVDIGMIYYIETDGKKTRLHTRAGDMTCGDSLKALEAKLVPFGFYRCHQAFLVNLLYVDSMTARDVIVQGNALPLSRYKKTEFLNALAKYAGRIL